MGRTDRASLLIHIDRAEVFAAAPLTEEERAMIVRRAHLQAEYPMGKVQLLRQGALYEPALLRAKGLITCPSGDRSSATRSRSCCSSGCLRPAGHLDLA